MTIRTATSIVTAGVLISAAILAGSYWPSRSLGTPRMQSADVVIGIRCVDYEEPLLVSPTPGALPTTDAGWVKKSDPFDVTIDTTRKVGWFEGGPPGVSEGHPADLTVEPSEYRLETYSVSRGQKLSQWLILDRINGSMGLYAQNQGMPTEVLKRGGICSELKARF